MTQTIQPGWREGPSIAPVPAIAARGLVKSFGTVQAVCGLDLQVEQGSIYALLGPNGAGKTTTINMLTTLVVPGGGTARICGLDVATRAAQVRRLIGVTFQETVVDKALSGREVLDIHGRLYHLPKAVIRQKIKELAALVELEEALNRPVKTYSGGMKRRLELARGLMTNPRVLFLDEPTLGLDPQNRDRIWTYIQRLRSENGLAILVTTHYMDEAEQLADRVGIIEAGRIVVEGTPAELIGTLGADVVTVSGEGQAEQFRAALRLQEFVEWVELHHDPAQVQIGLRASAGRSLRPIVELADRQGYLIADVSIKRPSLNEVFLKYTGRSLRD